MSLSRYTALAISENAAAAALLRFTASNEVKLADEINGTNTRPFLIHCRGRQETASARTALTPSPAACRENETRRRRPQHSKRPTAGSSALRRRVAGRAARAPV